jgi:glutamine amidotransferase
VACRGTFRNWDYPIRRQIFSGFRTARAAAAPFAAGPWLFSHNGAVTGWPQTLAALAQRLPPVDLLSLEARCDSALVWALVLNRLRAATRRARHWPTR